ncbi:Pimeloyl-ACP methyl ester carboxylesterase [Paenibacillus sp. UNCCL117]|uniref:alpha/beta fold hydrolase n=1 Tax=unclassified Paenibacillus TaxID=185978 RepID=UPI00088BCFF2|nr:MULTISPECIES: alpha/beta hydrolase [unclassified Paenibacillus]SDD61805.1 Pimeloyl-ACP methyl ester carboxylesterase [Paenibacillus sp. cl123]SFW67563.1 Pimeloyl-ACP methyl ester carboxylesterase [Paenibacillus sp. UNCCL117]
MGQRTADRGGWSLSYQEQGSGHPLVLLHGFCGSGAYWDEVVPLLDAHFRVIVPDLRGHGASGSPDEPCTIEQLADDIAALIDELGTEKAIVLGHSLGGYVTLALAERHADKLRAFGLIHSTAYPDDEKAKEGRLKGMQTIREQGLPVFIEGLVPKLFAPAHLETMPEAVRKAKEIGLGTSPEGAVRTLDAMRGRADRNAVLRAAELPLLLAAGEQDQIIPAERTFVVQGENVTQKLIPGTGHMSMMEAPKELANTILDWVASFA